MPQTRRGFVFMTGLLVLAGMASFVAIGLTRSMTEVLATNRFVASHQAFHLAEAGLDDGLAALAANSALGSPTPFTPTPAERVLASGTSSYTIRDGGNGTRRIEATGSVPNATAPTAQERLSATVQLAAPTTFPYAVMAGRLILLGTATIGDPFERAKLYIDTRSYGSDVALQATSNDTVWASTVDFRNPANPPQSLAVLCPSCADPSVFPTAPPPAPVFNTTGVTPLSLPAIDFVPYYEAALAADNNADPCEQYHYINAAPGSTVTLNGANCPNGLTGVVYVERGVDVKITNTFRLSGTIVHEGISCATQCTDGKIELAAGADLQIESRQGLGKGMAIIGTPLLRFRQGTFSIAGFVMAGGIYGGSKFEMSQIGTSGTITGGVLGVASFLPFAGVPGPYDAGGAIDFSLWPVEVKNATVLFEPLLESPTGFQWSGGGGGNTPPTMLLWSDG